MKLSLLQQSYFPRRSGNSRSSAPPHPAISSSDATPPSSKPSSFNVIWLFLHCLCCLISLILGFRFSRIVFLLLFSSSTTLLTTTLTTTNTLTHTLPSLPLLSASPNVTQPRVAVGRHGIRIRPRPHPNPKETMRAHRIIDRVQTEQRMRHGVKKHRPLIAVTPTYVRTFQTLHLTALMHSLMLVPYDLTWVVVEAGGVSNETASILHRSHLNFVHIPFPEGEMPAEWAGRRRMEARMRLHALRAVRDRRMDGIVLFADESNIHSMELFDEIQEVRWAGAVTVGILTPIPIQGPKCDPLPVLKLEWSGFVLNSRMVWGEPGDKPDWARNLDDVGINEEEIDSPAALLKNDSFVEPLGDCGKKVLLWWLRAEARSDSKFPSGWIMDPLQVSVPVKQTDRPDVLKDEP